MAEFPLDPQLSKVMLSAVKFNCMSEVLTITACLSSPNVFLRPK
jgi:pre-mRNA-splicing factor ATP-dependent RNA helicase DHX15/PRP43